MFTDLFRRKPLGEKARLEASERKKLNDVQCGGDLLRIIADGSVRFGATMNSCTLYVTSIFTTGLVKRMNLKIGDNVFAIIKATEVSVEK